MGRKFTDPTFHERHGPKLMALVSYLLELRVEAYKQKFPTVGLHQFLDRKLTALHRALDDIRAILDEQALQDGIGPPTPYYRNPDAEPK